VTGITRPHYPRIANEMNCDIKTIYNNDAMKKILWMTIIASFLAAACQPALTESAPTVFPPTLPAPTMSSATTAPPCDRFPYIHTDPACPEFLAYRHHHLREQRVQHSGWQFRHGLL